MADEQDTGAIMAQLHNSLRLQAAMLSKFEQREARMQATFQQCVQSLQAEMDTLNRSVEALVSDATTRIASDAKDAVGPVTTQYVRDLAAASLMLRRNGATLWMWTAAAGGLLTLTMVIGWAVLASYRSELASTKQALQRYDDALPVLQAYYASDASICDGRVCVNPEPATARSGGGKSYRRAKSRQ